MQALSIDTSVSALRFLFTIALDQPDLSRRLIVIATHASSRMC